MNSLQSKIAAARKVYETYWDSYTEGDLETFASTLDDRFEMIGTSETEVCHSKADGIEFLKAQLHELVGKVEMRNRQIDIVPIDQMMLVNELCDIYVLVDPDLPAGRQGLPADNQNWNFYSKIRISTFLRKTESGWKVTQQHGSLPDMRVQEGETLALEKISKENIELRDAVKRRTAELENKNRELAIEAALEKVRAVAMGMKTPEDMLDVCRAISDQLQQFGVAKIRNVQIAIIDEKIGQYLCYQYFTPYDKTTIEKTEYLKSPVEHGMVKQMLASRDGYFIGNLSGQELEDFRSHRKEENHFPDPFLDKATELDYCFLSIGEGGLGLTLYQPMADDVLTLFKRFHQVFSLAYQRFRDIEKAEAQAREAQIEAALERVRSRSMAMHKSEELLDVITVVSEQLHQLGFRFNHVSFANNEIDQDYKFWSSLKGMNPVRFNVPFANLSVFTGLKKAQQDGVHFYTDILSRKDNRKWHAHLLKYGGSQIFSEEINEYIMRRGMARSISINPNIILILANYASAPYTEEENKIITRFGNVFEQSYTRFLDLQKAEAQVREAQIEAALERVRAQTMAMHSSEDVGKCVVKMLSELTALGVDEGTRFGIGILNHENENNQLWTARKTGEEINMHIGNIDMASHPMLKSARKAWKEQVPFHKYVLEGEDLLTYYQMLNNAPDYKIQIPIEKLPKKEIQHCFIFEHGFFYAFSPREFQPELIHITKRFSALFEQTYRRYLDLVRAEGQAREAEIELALERVRARTMAMQHSDELTEASEVLDRQVRELGIETWGCAFHIYADDPEGDYEWFSSREGSLPFYKTPRENFFLKFYEKGKAGETFHVEEFLGDDCKVHYDYLMTIPVMGDALREIVASGASLPESQYDHIAFFKHGFLLFITYKPVPQSHAIFQRFSKVFDQTYTRFLDLQKAEAQAREAQIEGALERIRSRSLAMRTSDELEDVIMVVSEQLQQLQFRFHNVSFSSNNEQSDIIFWLATPGKTKPFLIKAPYLDTPSVTRIIDARKNGIDFLADVMSTEENQEWLQHTVYNSQSNLTEDDKKFLLTRKGMARSTVLTKNITLMLVNYAGVPFPNQQNFILKRFGNVFDQSYTRFLDLQKAEAQAREAQVNLAVERVRARALAMFKSEEILQVVHKLKDEIMGLDIPNVAAATIHLKEPDGMCRVWDLTSLEIEDDGLHLPLDIRFRLEDTHRDFFMRRIWENEADYFVVIQKDSDFKHTLQWLRDNNQSKHADEAEEFFSSTQLKKAYHPTVPLNNGRMNLDLLDTPDPEIESILKKMAGAFDLAYKRFEDLQKAEAQAREAQIEAALEKVRSRSLAMHKSGELKEVVSVLFEKLKVLQIPFTAVGIATHIDASKDLNAFVCGQNDAGLVITNYRLPYFDNPVPKDLYGAIEKQLEYFVGHYSKEEKDSFYEYVIEHTDEFRHLPEDIKRMIFDSTTYTISMVAVKNAVFNVNDFEGKVLAENEIDIIKRFARVFDQAYTRFLDLQKAEAQAREAQIQLSLERIRAKAMAMQHSDELSDFLTVLFGQFNVLNLNPVNCHLNFLDIENNRNIFRITGKRGAALIATQEIDLDASPLWEKRKEDWKAGHPNDVDVLYVPYENHQVINEIFEELLSKLPKEDRPLPEDFPDGLYVIDGYCRYGYLGYSASRPPSDEEKEITRRIANEFGNVYQRFLDLQKAESQAREAQIQLSLERIRAKAMSMLHSDELSDFLTVLFEQFEVLDLRPVNCILSLFDIENNRSTFRMTGKKGATLIASQEIDLDASPVWKQKVENWKSGHPNDVDVLYIPYENLPEIAEIFNEILEKLPEDERPLPEDYPNGEYIIDGYCKYGYLGYAASGPPSEEEKEIIRRIANEFGNVYQRFLDLQKAEAQAREAQIQLSLERIRAKAMSMLHSDELSDFLTVVFEQFHVLNLRPVASQLSFLDIDNNRSILRLTGKNGATLIATQEVDLDASPFWKQKVEDFKSGQPNDVDVVFVPYDKIPEIVEILKEILAKLPEDERPLPEDFPNGQYIVEGTFKYGYLGYSATGPPSDEEKEITHRIAHEFGNVYQRFIDLQKAEAQAREAEIQLALERVRARSLAMHRSEELADISMELVRQVQTLGMESWFCAFNIYDDDPRGSVEWGSNGQGTFPKYRTPREGVFLRYFEAGQRGETFLVNEIGEEVCPAHYEYLCSLPGVGEQLLQMKAAGIPFPTSQIDHVAFFKYGYVLFITYEPAYESHDIFKRFAKVFEQTYTRFLDIQKAEEQAREAQIENALEKVRSRTMAMQRSDELTDVAGLLFNQVSALGIKTWTAGFNVWSEDNNSYVDYLSLNGEIFGPNTVHTEKAEALKELSNARKSGVEFEVLFVEGEKIKELYLAISGIDEKEYDIMVKDGLLPSQQYEHFVFGAKVSVMFITYEPVPEAHDIFKRLGKVFEQTYTRFLDLQRAEAQAREAQIENALEKVRSRTMAMQRSDELTDVAGLLFNQVSALGIKTWSVGFNVWSEDNNSYVDYISLNGEFYGPNIVDTQKAEALKDVRKARKSGVEFEVLYVEGEKIKQLHMALGGVDEKEYEIMLNDGLLPSHEYEHFVFGAKVSVMFITYEPVPEAHDIFKRLGKVFEQTYTRFLDLQKAEAQAREAKIETALERVRAQAMAMHHSEDLRSTIQVYFEQLDELMDSTIVRCGAGLLNKENTIAEMSTASKSPEGVTYNVEGKIDMQGHALLENTYEHWLKQKEYSHVLRGNEIKEYYQYITNQVAIPENKGGDELHFYFPMFNEGSFYVVTNNEVPEDELQIFRRFSSVLSLTYRRFNDLQKAEAQAHEAKIEAALERVRSRTMGMQSSEELPEVANLLFTEVRAIGIHAWSCGYNILAEDKKSATCCMSSEGTLQTPFQLRLWGENSFDEMGEFVLSDNTMFVQELGGKALEEHYGYMKSFPDLKPTFDEIDRLGLSLPTYQINHLCKFTQGFILFITYEKVPESHAIFKRFTNVFDQTYTRFLDLKKAEAQAREAQIENALEKVRSRSLAMQSPDELIEVAQLLREEMGALGVEELETSSIYIHDESSGLTQCWFTIKNPDNPDKAITDQMVIDLQDTWVGRKMDEFYRSKAKQTSILMQGEGRIEWIRYCEEKSDLFGTSNFYGETIPDRTYHLYKFSNGYIGAAAPGEISSESWELLKRATAVFSFAYTRFRDLQMAQASARTAMRQASLDRVRADISSMRNADDLDRITPLIFKELTILGVPFIRCGVFIIDEKQELINAYLSSPEGNSLGVLRLHYNASVLTQGTVEAWRKGEVYRQHWNKEDFVQWINIMMQQDQIQDSRTYQGAAVPPESLDLHFVPFTQGMLYVGAISPLDERELELVTSLAKAFSIAYARYEDFEKLDKAKSEIESAMSELKSTQSQLIQQEKLASLGQLTAGIAHEIKNPLNFVNNFSEVSIELVDEAIEERGKSQEARNETLVDEILVDIKSNLLKVHDHGTRANSIVSSMLQHSRGGSGKIDPTDLNALVKEYVNLSFHGMRAGKNPIDVEISFDLDPGIADVPIIKEDFIRVIINLCNNAFDAMRQKTLQGFETLGGLGVYQPQLTVRTKSEKDQIRISFEDNGPGIPEEIKDKILQPFFTTKKGTEGTGLGLSITHDIVKAHGGELEITSQPGSTVFFIWLNYK
ncbi:ATP-binding protein [Algoriphagus sp.]|uniref:ATP-binding protein n=1 Tax=Algoriphagus sp. TaxID=1872435 RepID=UPI0039196829